jgi:hypothetical protein
MWSRKFLADWSFLGPKPETISVTISIIALLDSLPNLKLEASQVHCLCQLTELVPKLTVPSFTVLAFTVLALTVPSYLVLSFAAPAFPVLPLPVLPPQQRPASRSTISYGYHSRHSSSTSQKYSVQYCFYQ